MDKSSKAAKSKKPELVKRGLRAFRRAERHVRAESRKTGVPMIFSKNGKVIEVPG